MVASLGPLGSPEFSCMLFLERARVLRLRRSEQPTHDLPSSARTGSASCSIGSSKLISPATDTFVYACRAVVFLQHAVYPGALLFADSSGRSGAKVHSGLSNQGPIEGEAYLGRQVRKYRGLAGLD